MADLALHASASTSSRSPCARRSARRCRTSSSSPRFQQPLAIRFLTAQPGPLPAGKVTKRRRARPVLALPGVVQADVFLQVGETIRPVRLDGDRRGYVIAVGRHQRRGARARRGGGAAPGRGGRVSSTADAPHWRGCSRMSCAFDLAHYRELLEAAQARRLPVRVLRPRAASRATCCSGTTSTSRSTRRSRWPSSRPKRARGDLLPDDAERLLQPRLARGRACARAPARARAPRRPARRLPARRARRPLRPRRRLAQPRPRVHARAGRRRRQRDGGAVFEPDHYRSDSNQHWRQRLPARGARRAARSSGCSCSRIRRSGPTRARRCARRCWRCSTPSASRGSSSWPPTGSTSREPLTAHGPRLRLAARRERRR